MTPRIEEPMEERKYRPSNGTEGEGFIEHYCRNCIHGKYEHTCDTNDNPCDILTRSLVCSIDDKDYPEEWVYNEQGRPTCKAHVPWDWQRDDDGNWIEPEPPPPYDPNQLVMPFAFEELENQTFKVVPDYEWDIN